MYTRGIVTKICRQFGSAKGLTLVETLIAVAILGAIGVALLSGMYTGYRSLAISQEKTYAESLAKSQVEYIKSQPYISVLNYDPSDPEKRYQEIEIPAHLASAGYDVEIIVSDNAVTPAGRAGFELESITVEVKRYDVTKLTIEFYRVGLAL